MQGMRIAYMLTSLGVGGAERMTAALARCMADRGHHVLLLVLRPRGGSDLSSELRTIHLGMGREPLSVLGGMVRARGILRGYRPDIVHSHSFHANLVARMLKLSLPRLAVVSTVHNIYEGGWQRMLAYRLTDALSRKTVCVSESVAQNFVARHAVSAGRCMVVPNAIELEQFTPQAERRAQMRAAMGTGDEFVWLAVGRDAPAKDYPNLLKAFGRVHAECSNSRLWIAGAARPAGSAGSDSISWLGIRDDIPALLDAADGFAMSSAWEGMPLAIIEAMAMEKPVVATDVGGVREVVGEHGVLVSPRDPAKLAEAMAAVMGMQRDARAAMGSAARKRIRDEFDMGEQVVEWESLYAGLIAAG